MGPAMTLLFDAQLNEYCICAVLCIALPADVGIGVGICIEHIGILASLSHSLYGFFESGFYRGHEIVLRLGKKFLCFFLELHALFHEELKFLLALEHDVFWEGLLTIQILAELFGEVLFGANHLLIVGFPQFLHALHGLCILWHGLHHVSVGKIGEGVCLIDNLGFLCCLWCVIHQL